jgi:hypothetical protein
MVSIDKRKVEGMAFEGFLSRPREALLISFSPLELLKVAMESKVKELTAARKFEGVDDLIAEEPASFLNDAIIKDIR